MHVPILEFKNVKYLYIDANKRMMDTIVKFEFPELLWVLFVCDTLWIKTEQFFELEPTKTIETRIYFTRS